MDLKWKIKPWGEATVIELDGEIDLHTASGLKKALLEVGESPSARIALDLSDVSFLDSTGIGTLVGMFKKTRESGGQIAFFGAKPRVKRVFQIAGLWNVLPFHESRDAALASLLPVPSPSSAGSLTDESMAQGQGAGHE